MSLIIQKKWREWDGSFIIEFRLGRLKDWRVEGVVNDGGE